MQTASLIRCSVNKDVVEYISKERNLTLDLAIKSTHIEDLIRSAGEKDVLKAITGAILMASEYFNVKGDMSETQAVQTASLFMEQHPLETFEDILLCLKNAKLGRYGPVYNRLDGQTLFTWFRLYLDEKYERFEQIKRSERMEAQKETDETFLMMANKFIEGNQKVETRPERELTYEKHYNSFAEVVPLFTKEELEKSLEYYKNQETLCINRQYGKYIDLLESTLKDKS